MEFEVNYASVFCTKKPEGILKYKIFYETRKKHKKFTTAKLAEMISYGMAFTPALLSTPIKNDNMEDFIVGEDEWKKNKGIIQVPFVGNKKIRPWEVGLPLVYRTQTCWTSQQIFGLDFDNEPGQELSSQDAMKRCKLYDLKPFLAYPTFSSTETREKYRILFRIEEPITDNRAAKAAQAALMEIFPECDPKCGDLARVFYGTNKKKIWFNSDASLDISNLFSALYCSRQEKDKKNYSRNNEAFCKKHGLHIFNNLPAVVQNKDIINEMQLPDEHVYSWRNVHFAFNCTEREYKFDGAKAVKRKNCKDVADVNDCENRKYGVKKFSNKEFEVHREFSFGELTEKCELARKFVEGVHIGHDDLFRLMTNAIHVEGGQSWFLKNLEKSEQVYSDGKYDKMQSDMKFARKSGYNCTGCRESANISACSYIEGCSHGRNMLEQVILKRNDIVALETTGKKKTLAQAEQELEAAISNAYGQAGVHIIKAPTGLGKTRLYIELAKPGDVIVTPTHSLNEEIGRKLGELGKEYIIARARPSLDGIEEQQEYHLLQSAGNSIAANSLYIYKAEGYRSAEYRTPGQQDCIDWLDEQRELETTDKIIIATHAKLAALNNQKIKNVFVDEDIFDTCLIEISKVALCDIEKLIDELEAREDGFLHDYVNKLYECIKAKIENRDQIIYRNINLPAYKRHRISELVRDTADKYVSKICAIFDMRMTEESIWFDPNSLESEDGSGLDLGTEIKTRTVTLVPQYKYNRDSQEYSCDTVSAVKLRVEMFLPDVSYIMMSATASKPLLEKVKPGVDFTAIDVETNQEQTELYFWRSCSKSSLNKMIKDEDLYLEFIKEMILLDAFIITFKSMKEILRKLGFKNICDEMHFGKTAGFDHLKGKNIAVVGTYHLNEHAYICTAAALGVDCYDTTRKYVTITRNDFRFRFNTYADNLELREIHLHSVETELIQAVGRARTLRTDAIVQIFSNYPIPNVKLMKYGDDFRK